MFDEEMDEKIIAFIEEHKKAETLLVHCYGGQSRSRAVGAFAVKMLGGDNSRYFKTGVPCIDIVNITLHFFLKDVQSMLLPAVNHSISVS